MMNYIWAAMIIIGVIFAAISGNLEEVTNAAIDSAKDAVALCITMFGVMSLWVGLMEVAKECGIIKKLTKGISPFVNYMFPDIPKDHKAREYISTNIVANILGLGWAATPAGLKAMEELGKLKEEREAGSATRNIASNEMCTFLIINISSLQLIPVNIIAYRSQYGSVNPAAVIGPGLLATLISTLAAVIFCRLFCRKGYVN